MEADPLAFPKFSPSSQSLIKRHLTPDLFKVLKDVRTNTGFSLISAIQSGLKNADSSIGIYAGDEDFYHRFKSLLEPIIKDYHKHQEHGVAPLFEPVKLPDIDPEARHIISTRIRLARNINGFCFPCHLSLEDRKAVEKKIIQALDQLPETFGGKYHSYETVDHDLLFQLKQDKIAFSRGDRFQDAAGLNTDFPKGRGVFLSQDKKSMIWVHEEDHLRIISLEKSSRLDLAFERLCDLVRILGHHLQFSHNNRLGFLTSCPTNIGTTMRAGVHIRLEKLNRNPQLLKQLTQKYQFQIRGTGGEKTKVDQAVFDISNRQRLGICETDIIKNLHTGLAEIIHTEENL